MNEETLNNLTREEAISLLDSQIDYSYQLEHNWNELKKWLKEQDVFITELPAFTKDIGIEHRTMSICYENILDKMQELEEGGNNDC